MARTKERIQCLCEGKRAYKYLLLPNEAVAHLPYTALQEGISAKVRTQAAKRHKLLSQDFMPAGSQLRLHWRLCC